MMAKVSMVTRMVMGLAAAVMLLDVAVVAVDHTVGAPNGGWDLSTDLRSWASAQTFSVGDNIVFQYAPIHDVLEVTEANYNSCGTGSPISVNTTSPTTFRLATAGSRYFICGIGTHCSQGMKVQINTVAAAPPRTTTPSAPSPPTEGPTANSPPPPVTGGETVNPPSSAIPLTMTASTIFGFGFLVMMLLSL